jgi:hypothetical protein
LKAVALSRRAYSSDSESKTEANKPVERRTLRSQPDRVEGRT